MRSASTRGTSPSPSQLRWVWTWLELVGLSGSAGNRTICAPDWAVRGVPRPRSGSQVGPDFWCASTPPRAEFRVRLEGLLGRPAALFGAGPIRPGGGLLVALARAVLIDLRTRGWIYL